MLWIKISGETDPEDIPRFLTEEEIQDVCDNLPMFFAADTYSAYVARQAMIEVMKMQLRQEKISPSQIVELKAEIKIQHNKSLIPPGAPIGLTAAEAVGACATQMTLNTHRAGETTSVTLGIARLQDLLFARKKPSGSNCIVHFKDKFLSYAEVLDKRVKFVGVTVSSLVDTPEIMSVNDLEGETPYSHMVYQTLYNRGPIPKSKYFMRLPLKLTEMYKHRITLTQLANTLEKESPQSVQVIYGSLADGYVDLYPDPEAITETLKKHSIPEIEDSAEMIFLHAIVRPELSKINVKGIPEIEGITPIVVPVLSAVLDCTRVLDTDTLRSLAKKAGVKRLDDPVWSLNLDELHMKSNGLDTTNVLHLCEEAHVPVLACEPYKIYVQLPTRLEELSTTADVDPSKEGVTVTDSSKKNRDKLDPVIYIRGLLDRDRRIKIQKSREISKDKGLKYYLVPDSELTKASQYIYLRTQGSNLLEILGDEDVDPVLTYSNNIHEMAEIFGIEAAKFVLYRELLKVVADNGGSNVDAAHLWVICSAITLSGKCYGMTPSGISRQGCGPIAAATLEKSRSVMASSALKEKEASATNVSTAVAIGAEIHQGTGSVNVGELEGITGTDNIPTEKMLINDLITEKYQRDLYEELETRSKRKQATIEEDELSAATDRLGEMEESCFRGAKQEDIDPFSTDIKPATVGAIGVNTPAPEPTTSRTTKTTVDIIPPRPQLAPAVGSGLLDIINKLKGELAAEPENKVKIVPLSSGLILQTSKNITTSGLVPVNLATLPFEQPIQETEILDVMDTTTYTIPILQALRDRDIANPTVDVKLPSQDVGMDYNVFIDALHRAINVAKGSIREMPVPMADPNRFIQIKESITHPVKDGR